MALHAAALYEAAQLQAQAHCAQLEQELTGLRQAHGELNARSAKEQAASAEAAKRLRELEERLGQRTAESEKAKGELEQRTSEHGKVESNLRKQLEVAGAAAAQNEAAQKQAQARCGQLEQEFLDGSWFLHPCTEHILFKTPADKIWQTLLRALLNSSLFPALRFW